MKLVITFPCELIPFIMNDSEDECIRAVNTARSQGWDFAESDSVVKSDFICLHAFRPSHGKPISRQRRYYIHGEEILLKTTADQPDEVVPTKELLAYEKGYPVSEIMTIVI